MWARDPSDIRTQNLVGRKGIEPPQSKTADLQSAELTTCSTYPWKRPRSSCGPRWIGNERYSRWSRRRDSNPEPAVYKTAALPIELRRRAEPYRRRSVAPEDDRAQRPNGSSGPCSLGRWPLDLRQPACRMPVVRLPDRGAPSPIGTPRAYPTSWVPGRVEFRHVLLRIDRMAPDPASSRTWRAESTRSAPQRVGYARPVPSGPSATATAAGRGRCQPPWDRSRPSCGSGCWP